jgi:hypothetical protein
MVGGVDTLQHRQAERGRLAGTGLCEGHHVALLTEQMGYHLRLHGHRLFKSKLFNGLQQRRAYS